MIVSTSEVAVIERCGKFDRMAGPGLNCICVPWDMKAGLLSYRVQQLDVRVETKTLDNVFIYATVSVQYQVMQNKVRMLCCVFLLCIVQL